MNVPAQLLIGLIMLVLTVGLNAGMIVFCSSMLEKREGSYSGPVNKVMALTVVTVWLAIGLLLAMSVWAILFIGFGLFQSFDGALYFTMTAFTTVGFGDVVLPPEWGLLAGSVATDGFILFGLDTAFLFEVLRRLHES